MIDGFLALYIFMLAAFTGDEIIGKVPVILHTPLMSVNNAISGIIILGGLAQFIPQSEGAVSADINVAILLGLIAVFFATLNIAGGFFVSHRMLKMFQT